MRLGLSVLSVTISLAHKGVTVMIRLMPIRMAAAALALLNSPIAFSDIKHFETSYGEMLYDQGALFYRGKQIYPSDGEKNMNSPHYEYRLKEPDRETIILNAGSNGCPAILVVIQISNERLRVTDRITSICNEVSHVTRRSNFIEIRQSLIGENDHIAELDLDNLSVREFEEQARSISSNPNHLVDEYPLGIVTSSYWQPKFADLMGNDYDALVKQIGFASPPRIIDGWLIGSGTRKYTDLAGMIAIHLETGSLIAAINDAQRQIISYGTDLVDEIPISFLEWTYKNSILDPLELFQQGVQFYEKGSYESALTQFKKAAELEHLDSYKVLFYFYRHVLEVSEDDEEPVYWLRKAAELGDAESQAALGVQYQRGTGVPQDYEKAIHWIEKAALQNDPLAQMLLGAIYISGPEKYQNSIRAVKWLEKSAQNENADAMYLLGTMYLHGHGVKEDMDRSLYWIVEAARRGNPLARKALGNSD